MLAAELRAVPWAVPGAIAVLIIASVSSGYLSRRLDVAWGAAFWLVVSLGAIVVATLTPGIDAGAGRQRFASFSFDSGAWQRLTSLNAISLNVLLFMPLAGLAVAGPRRVRLALTLVAVALVLPVAIEWTQWLFPQLGRTGFQLTIALMNTLGVLIGAVFGLFIRTWIGPMGARPNHPAAQTTAAIVSR